MLKFAVPILLLSLAAAASAATPATGPAIDTAAWAKHSLDALGAIGAPNASGVSPAWNLYPEFLTQFAILKDKASVAAVISLGDKELPDLSPMAPGERPEGLERHVIWAQSTIPALEAAGDRDAAREVTRRYEPFLKNYLTAGSLIPLVKLQAHAGDWEEFDRLAALLPELTRSNSAADFAIIAIRQKNKEHADAFMKAVHDMYGTTAEGSTRRDVVYLEALRDDPAAAEKEIEAIAAPQRWMGWGMAARAFHENGDAKAYANAVEKWSESPGAHGISDQLAAWGDVAGAKAALAKRRAAFNAEKATSEQLYGLASECARAGDIAAAMDYAGQGKAKRDTGSRPSDWGHPVYQLAGDLFRAGADKEAEGLLAELTDPMVLGPVDQVRKACVEAHIAKGDIDGAAAYARGHTMGVGVGTNPGGMMLVAQAYAAAGNAAEVEKIMGKEANPMQYALLGQALAAGKAADLDKRYGQLPSPEAKAWFCLGVLKAATAALPRPPVLGPVPALPLG